MDVNGLRQAVDGEVVSDGQAGFESRLREMTWNRLAPASRPAAIVRVTDESDVIACVRFARNNGLRLTTRGGGHNWYGTPLRAGVLLLDLSALDGVAIDVAARTAIVQPVVESRDFARRLAAHGLAFPVGHCPGVKLSGYLLSGGLGWNPGTWSAGRSAVTTSTTSCALPRAGRCGGSSSS